MKTQNLLCVALLFVTGLTGCSTVVSKNQLGAAAPAEETKQLEGVWLAGENSDPLVIKHIKDNELRIAGVEWKANKFSLIELTAFVNAIEDQRYVNVVDSESPPDQPQFTFAKLIAPNDDCLLVCLASVKSFEQAVEAGRLSGTIKKDKNSTTVTLDSSTEDLNRFIDPLKSAEQFEIESPLVLRRVGKVEGNQK